jgi:hypothetical protein
MAMVKSWNTNISNMPFPSAATRPDLTDLYELEGIV